MNTPRKPKKPVRYKKRTNEADQINGGTFGLTDSNYATEIGFITTYWTHVEDELMGRVFLELMAGGSHTGHSHHPFTWSSREVFRSIVSQKARITVMRALLQKAPHNAHLSNEYDQIIDEFESINRIRNDYVHGIWMVENNTNKVFFWNPGAEIIANVDPRFITLNEVRNVSERMRALMKRILTHKPEPLPD